MLSCIDNGLGATRAVRAPHMADPDIQQEQDEDRDENSDNAIHNRVVFCDQL